MIDEGDVRLAYRLFLGREPENEVVVRAFQGRASLEELRGEFLSSAEFQMVSAPYREKYYRLLLAQSDMSVEINASEGVLKSITDRIKRAWRSFGEDEPYWSVLSSDQFKVPNFEENREEFYRSGVADVEVMLAFFRRSKATFPTDGRCLEVGCGVGRVTAALAPRIRSITAYDISRSHLKLAKEQLKALGIRNAEFVSSADIADLRSLQPFDFIFSIIVLQHNPPPIIAKMIRSICQLLAAGGCAYFQVPTYFHGYRFNCNEYLSQSHEQHKIEMHAIPQSDIFEIIRSQACAVLEVREDNMVGSPGFVSNTFFIQKEA